jgi:peptide/nickel transport system permease protein
LSQQQLLPSTAGRDFMRRASGNRSFVIGSSIVLVYLVIALLGSWLAPYDPYKQNLERTLEGVSWSHPLGRDELGRDILSRIMTGARLTLGITAVATLLGLTIGVSLGAISGFFGGRTDAIIMTGINVMLGFPELLIALAIISVLGSGTFNLMLAIGLGAIPSFARLVRASVLVIRTESFVDAARAMGFSARRVILRHILPNMAAPLLVHTTYTMAAAILIASGLSFLGLGVQPPASEWGVMLSRGRDYFRVAPHLVTTPGLAITFAVLGINLIGDGLRDLLDPKLIRS